MTEITDERELNERFVEELKAVFQKKFNEIETKNDPFDIVEKAPFLDKITRCNSILEGFKELEHLRQHKADALSISRTDWIGDRSDLPPELLEQLNLPEPDDIEKNVLEIIKEFGGKATLDQLLVFLFRKSGVVHNRNQLAGKLYRMTKKEMIFNVPKKKGVYVLYELRDQYAEIENE